jgi:hypothetical protein
MAYNKNLAKEIYTFAQERFPDAISNRNELRVMLKSDQHTDEDLRLALEALRADGWVQFNPVETGHDKFLRDFTNLKVTPKGRNTVYSD